MPITIKNDAPELMEFLPAQPHPTQFWHCFKSPESMCNWLEDRRSQYWWFRDARDDRDSTFRGTKSFDEALNLCRDGWPEGTERVANLRDRINAQNPIGHRIVRYDVAGSVPNVARMLAGNPMHMRRQDNSRLRRKPIITLVNNIGGYAGVAANTFVNKCAVVAALVDAIEGAGYSCHAIGISQTQTHDSQFLSSNVVNIKSPSESVDIGRLAYALGHVAFFRRLGFSVRGADIDNKPLGQALGTTCDFPEGAAPEGVYILPSMQVNESMFTTEDKASTVGLQHFISELTKQGCPAFPNQQAA